jgi:hypothetical protein
VTVEAVGDDAAVAESDVDVVVDDGAGYVDRRHRHPPRDLSVSETQRAVYSLSCWLIYTSRSSAIIEF